MEMKTLKEQLFELFAIFKKIELDSKDRETIEIAIDQVEDLINKIKPLAIE